MQFYCNPMMYPASYMPDTKYLFQRTLLEKSVSIVKKFGYVAPYEALQKQSS